ncbi:MAG TPA: hypothetical protein VIX59_20695 [Candidatus Binataceae bacterium]
MAHATIKETGPPIRFIRREELGGALFGKPSRGNFIGETMKFEKRSVNSVALGSQTFIDETAAAFAANLLDDLLTGSKFERAAKPIVCFPGREIRFHLVTSRAKFCDVRCRRGTHIATR